MGRPFKDSMTEKHDRIIAKVYRQLYRWGFPSTVIEPILAKVAYTVLGRANNTQTGNSGFICEEDRLSVHAIEEIYKTWSKANTSYFSRINHPKAALQSTAPKLEHIEKVISFFITYMNQEPEQCIFKSPPEYSTGGWWRMYDGELDGDLPLSPKAEARKTVFPSIKRKK